VKHRVSMLRLLLSALILQSTGAWAASPWLPEAGRVTATVMYVTDEFSKYRPGADKGTLPFPYGQQTFYGFLEYGLAPKLALDVETGSTETAFRGNSLGGITDSTVGLRYQLKSGERYVVSLRGAAIINGTYDITTAGNWSPGDKASGGLGSLMAGWSLPAHFFSFLETGYRIRTSPVPQDYFGSAGIGSGFKRFSWTASYQMSRSINGKDIRGTLPRFTPAFNATMFPATKKVFDAVDFATYYRLRDDLTFGFNYGKIFNGRNVGLKRIYAVSVSYALPWKLPHFSR
jgi:hypothetical protein